MPGGEALTQAWKELAHLWDMEDKIVAAETQSEAAGSSYMGGHAQPARQPNDNRGKKRPGEGNIMSGARLAGVDNNKKKICGAWSSLRGCVEPCPKKQRHACSVIDRNNRVCLRTDHTAVTCPTIGRG